ncbi:MAG TPA: amidohydrolase family protein, partial [Rhodanobacteraceae bacterium]|nr:amidohydrolase family protein [Rhodanobacteraceae bacterium]
VPEAAMREVLASPIARSCPIHIHIAEQVGEVQDCLSIRNARPVQWLFDHAKVDANWCLVHATHLDDAEMHAIAESGAVAGLCPTTEANLGDGLFPLAGYLDANGTLGIGSDSHISVSPVEELRWLEYGQRLVARQRNIAAREPGASVGETLWRAALQGGRQASGMAPFGAGARADLLVLDDQSPLLAARGPDNVLDSFIFAGNTPLVREVMVNGEWVVRAFRHRDEAGIGARFRACVEKIAESKARSP